MRETRSATTLIVCLKAGVALLISTGLCSEDGTRSSSDATHLMRHVRVWTWIVSYDYVAGRTGSTIGLNRRSTDRYYSRGADSISFLLHIIGKVIFFSVLAVIVLTPSRRDLEDEQERRRA
jgi:hypothetical protein